MAEIKSFEITLRKMHTSENKGPEELAFNDKYNGEVRKKRDEYVVEIRRQKREGILNKKRNTTLDNDKKTEKDSIAEFEADDNMDPNTKALKTFIEDCLKSVYTMEEFPGVVEAVASKDKFQQYYGVIGLRKILSTEADPPIQATIDQNLVPRLITYMQRDDEPRLQLEAAWALTNIASGTSQQTQSIIDKNGIPAFVRLLKSPRQDIAEQALWAIGNISGDSPIFRDMILKYGALEPLISIINNAKNELVLQHGTWALSNLCRGRPQPKFESVYKAIPIFSYVIQKTNQSETLADAAWAMTFLTDGKDERIEMVVQTGIIPSLVKHIETEHLTILIPMLRTLGNILTGNEKQTSMVLEIPGVVDKLFNLLNFKHKAVQREACWAISNITGGSSNHIECVIKDPAHIRTILSLVESDAPELRREAIWVLSNATCNANADQMVRLCQHGLIECFCELLESEDPHVLEVVLIGLKNIFECGVSLAQQYNTDNKFLLEFEIKGGTQKIEKLQTHQSNPVYTKALHLLETYFEIEDSFQ